MDWLVFLYSTKQIHTWLFVLCHIMSPWSFISCILKFYSPNHLSPFKKVALDLVLFTGVLVLLLYLSVIQEFSGARFALGRTQKDSDLEATKCLAKYLLMKAICYNIIQNKSWLTYLLELFLKEIIHKTERCEAVNIICIDWGEKKMLYLRGDRNKGLATSSESIVLVRIKICVKGFVQAVSLLWEETVQQDDKWRIIQLYFSLCLQMT